MIKLIAQAVDVFAGDGKHPYARTGELDFSHLKKAGATGVIIGHSEAGETPEACSKKLVAAFAEGLKNNVVLLGESWQELGKSWPDCTDNEKERVKKIVKDKFLKILESVNKDVAQAAIFGYEPGWGVRGSGKADVPPPQPDQIGDMAHLLRETLSELYGKEISRQIRIIYGGSSSPERTKEIMPIEDIDGFILGSAGTTASWVKEIGDLIIGIAKTKRAKRKPVLILNWKAYILQEPYEDFLKTVSKFGEENLEIYLAPPATDLYLLKEKLSPVRNLRQK